MADPVSAAGIFMELAAELRNLFSELGRARRESRIRVADYLERLASALLRMKEDLAKGVVPHDAGREFKDSMSEFRSILYQTFRSGSTRGEEVVGRLSARLSTLLGHAEAIDWHFIHRPFDEPPESFKLWTTNMQRAAGDLRGLANRLRAL